MRKYLGLIIAASALSGLGACSSDEGEGAANEERAGEIEVALTNAPRDTACLRITIVGSRTDVRTFPLTPGQNASYRLKGVPVGKDTISADAFPTACNALSGVDATWYSEAVVTRVAATEVTHVALSMIHNGKLSVGVDFDEAHAPTGGDEEGPTGGTFSSAKPYFLPTAPGIVVKAILTTGDSPNLKPDGVTPWRMVGIPDGSGALDNGDGSFTLFTNQELPATSGGVRAHGAKGAFVSKYVIRKADLAVLHGEDLIQSTVLFNPATSAYEAPSKGTAFARFCSADLPAPSALFDVASGLGFDGRMFFNGEESDGRALAHGLDGVTYELPRLGKASFENVVLAPSLGRRTVAALLDDSTPGQVYFYAGTKTASGSPIEKAGLTNGTLYGLRVVGFPSEPSAGIPSAPVELYDLGNVETQSSSQLELASNSNLVSRFNRPEDGAWDPNSPNDFYFVTTNAFSAPSRLWRVRFIDASKPQKGGTIEMLLDGTEGHKMLDNMAFDQLGHIYLEEDVGGNDWLGRVLRYDIATDTLTPILTADPTLFDPTINSPTFQTRDEEGSGIFDASDILGPGWLITVMQNHKANSDPELVEGGQIMAFYDPAGAP